MTRLAIVVMKLPVVMIPVIPISYISRLMAIWYGMSGLSTYTLICITQQTIRMAYAPWEDSDRIRMSICPVIRCCMHFRSREPDPIVFVQTANTDVTEQLHMLPGLIWVFLGAQATQLTCNGFMV